MRVRDGVFHSQSQRGLVRETPRVRTHLKDLVFDSDARERRLVRQQRDLVPQHLCVARLHQQGREAGKVAEERRDVGVREVLLDRVAEETLDRVEVVVFGVGVREVVVGLLARGGGGSGPFGAREEGADAPGSSSSSRMTWSGRPRDSSGWHRQASGTPRRAGT